MSALKPIQTWNGGSQPPPPLVKWPWIWIRPVEQEQKP